MSARSRSGAVTLFLGPEHLDGRMSQALALRAMEDAFGLEAEARTQLPTRMDVPSDNGFLRVMPAVLDDVMGLKVMTLAQGLGTRYVVLLHDVQSGELLAILDADEITRFRTGATTAFAARLMVPRPPRRIGLLGSGFEAIGQLRALAALWPLDEVFVFSPTVERRTRFAQAMSAELGIAVRAVESRDAAIDEQAVVVLATKSTDAVLDGRRLAPGTVVLSIGSTRPDLRELDRATLARAGTLVGDDPAQLPTESGDVADALEHRDLSPARIVSLADLAAGRASLDVDESHDLLVFKSVGTALQDLAMARALYRDATANEYGADLGTVASLKPFVTTS